MKRPFSPNSPPNHLSPLPPPLLLLNSPIKTTTTTSSYTSSSSSSDLDVHNKVARTSPIKNTSNSSPPPPPAPPKPSSLSQNHPNSHPAVLPSSDLDPVKLEQQVDQARSTIKSHDLYTENPSSQPTHPFTSPLKHVPTSTTNNPTSPPPNHQIRPQSSPPPPTTTRPPLVSAIPPGFRGLQNLGNTCFMNSALQCMSNTPFLNDLYFNSEAWVHEVNKSNPLGMKGAMAITYAALVRALWSSSSAQRFVSPRKFKFVMAQFAPQFSGYAQHDSSELLGFLLDGLHEDLNRVQSKPYFESKDTDTRPDVEVANEQWANHRARNDSIIVDLFQGQYKSRVQCLHCKNISTTFDPFMVLTLPIPSVPLTIPIHVTAVKLPNTYQPPSPVNAVKLVVHVRQDGSISDLVKLVAKYAFTESETYTYSGKSVVYEVFQRHVYAQFPEYILVSEITSNDEIWVVEVPNNDLAPIGYPISCINQKSLPTTPHTMTNSSPFHDQLFQHASTTPHSPTSPALQPNIVCVLLSHQKQRAYPSSYMHANSKNCFGCPCVAYLVSPFNARQATSAVIASMQAWTTFPIQAYLDANPSIDPVQLLRFDVERTTNSFEALNEHTILQMLDRVSVTWDASVSDLVFADVPVQDNTVEPPFSSRDGAAPMMDHRHDGQDTSVNMNDMNVNGIGSVEIQVPGTKDQVSDPNLISMAQNGPNVEFTGHQLWSRIPDLGTVNAPVKQSGRTSYTLKECFDTFVAEERLGVSDPVYCRKCAKHQEASKKVDIWRAPKILVIALKRFGVGNRYRRDKIDAMVDCPLVLDIHERVLEPQQCTGSANENVYDLYAVSNHYGGMGGGHYTAYALNAHTQMWYEFDDARVSSVNPDNVISPASYVLFYRKRGHIQCNIPNPKNQVSVSDMQHMISQDVESAPTWSHTYGSSSSMNLYSPPRPLVHSPVQLTLTPPHMNSPPLINTPPHLSSPLSPSSPLWQSKPSAPRRTEPAALVAPFPGPGHRLDGLGSSGHHVPMDCGLELLQMDVDPDAAGIHGPGRHTIDNDEVMSDMITPPRDA